MPSFQTKDFGTDILRTSCSSAQNQVAYCPPSAYAPEVGKRSTGRFCNNVRACDVEHEMMNQNYLENKLLLISINFTPETSRSCLKFWCTTFSR